MQGFCKFFVILALVKAKKATVRLNKYLANAGIASRRKIGELLKKGEVLVNGRRVLEPGERIDPGKDEIFVNGKKLQKSAHLVYIALNKPRGVVSTVSDELGRKTVVSLVGSPVRIYPVGRLDADSIGLILLTSDGELAHRLTHPKFHVPKTYEVIVHGKAKRGQLDKLNKGVMLKDGMTAPAQVEVIKEFGDTTKLQFVLHEGRNRQVRRMCGKVGLEVLELKRVGFGPIKLEDLPEGGHRHLTENEVSSLLNYLFAFKRNTV